MTKCLGFYGASDKTSRELNYDGCPPIVTPEVKEGIYQAIEKSYPQIKNMSERDKRAVAKWMVNEG
jgi:hypothetical protein